MTVGTVYQALSDGIVEAYSELAQQGLIGYCGDTADAGTKVMQNQPRYSYELAGITFHVQRGKYWRVDKIYKTTADQIIYFTPIR